MSLERVERVEREMSECSWERVISEGGCPSNPTILDVLSPTAKILLWWLASSNYGVFFWWNDKSNSKRIHWLAWDKLCRPKSEGGLWFCNLYAFNLGLLAKQGWKLLVEPQSMVARLLKARYFPHSSFLDADVWLNTSFVWRSICVGQKIITQWSRWQIGDKSCTQVWGESGYPIPSPSRFLHQGLWTHLYLLFATSSRLIFDGMWTSYLRFFQMRKYT